MMRVALPLRLAAGAIAALLVLAAGHPGFAAKRSEAPSEPTVDPNEPAAAGTTKAGPATGGTLRVTGGKDRETDSGSSGDPNEPKEPRPAPKQ